MIERTLVQVSGVFNAHLVVITVFRMKCFRHFFSFAINVVHFLKCILQNLNRNSVIKDISGKPMRVLDLYSIWIKYFKDLLLHEINQIFADTYFEADDIDFVLTVPALFGDGATLFFREAAINVSCRNLCT